MFQVFYIIICFVFLYLIGDIYWLSCLGFALAISEVVFFFCQLDKSFVIYRFGLLLAILQWFVAPFVDYIYFGDHDLYYMYVPEEEYMQLVVPALFLFKIGIEIFGRKTNEIFIRIKQQLDLISAENLQQLAKLLLISGLVFTVLSEFSPPGLGFVFYLLANLKYVGGIVLFYSNKKLGIWVNSFLLILLSYESLSGGMFHELLLWIILLLPFFFLKTEISLFRKFLALLLLLILTFTVQTVKEDYRQIIWASNQMNQNNIEIFSGLIEKKGVGDFSESNLHNLNIRFNQGWIISRIMSHVPNSEEYAEGETINSAIVASLTPRALNADKKGAGGQLSFERFTGLELHGSTSMGTSILGEAYANYGILGSYIFLFLWGLFFGFLIYQHLKYSLKNPYFFFFLPWVYIEAIKAETDLITVLNYITKAYLLLFSIMLALRLAGLKPNLKEEIESQRLNPN